MMELCFKCKKGVLKGCGYYYLGNSFHARCLRCCTCEGKLIGKPFLTSEEKIFCNDECARIYELNCDATTEPATTSVEHSPNQTRSVSPDEPLFVPTMGSSPVPAGAVNRMYRTDSLSSDLSGTSHTSESSYTHDANKKPKKRILKQPHEKRMAHRSKHVHWRLDEVVDSHYDGDNTSLDSSDAYAGLGSVPKYGQGWKDTEEQGKLQGKVQWMMNPQWKDVPEATAFQQNITTTSDELDIDMPFDETYMPKGTPLPRGMPLQVNMKDDVQKHQLTTSPLTDSNSTPLVVTSNTRSHNTIQEDNHVELLDTPIYAADTAPQDNNLLTSTPVVLRRKNGTNSSSMPPVLKLRDSMVCELEDSIYDYKPDIFQFPDLNIDGSPSVGKKVAGVPQLSPLLEDTASLPSILKINETSQLAENSMRSQSDQGPFQFPSMISDSGDSSTMSQLDKDEMGQNIVGVTKTPSPEHLPNNVTPNHVKTASPVYKKSMPTQLHHLKCNYASSETSLATPLSKTSKLNHLTMKAGSTSSLPVNLSSYMINQTNSKKFKDISRDSSHNSLNGRSKESSVSSLPTSSSNSSSLGSDSDDIDTPLSRLDETPIRASLGRQNRNHSTHAAQSSKTMPMIAQKGLDAIMNELEQEDTHKINNNISKKSNNTIGCGVCHRTVADSELVIDGVAYHVPCYVCVACGRSLRGKKVCKAKGQLYCEEDFLYYGFRLNQRMCDHCKMPIISQGGVSDLVEAYKKTFHRRCFQCMQCYTTLATEEDSRLLEGRPVCTKCHLLVLYQQTTPTIRRTAQPVQAGYSEML